MTTPSQRNNSAFVGAALAYATREAEMAAFDALPTPLRRAVDEFATKLSAATVLRHLGWALGSFGTIDRAVAATRRKLAEIETAEIGVMAGRYEATCGRPYPHTAARATILRYGSVEPVRGRRAIMARRLAKLTPNLQIQEIAHV